MPLPSEGDNEMDPNAALAQIRDEVHEILTDRNPDPERLAELVNGLDEWLTNGGFLPDGWQR